MLQPAARLYSESRESSSDSHKLFPKGGQQYRSGVFCAAVWLEAIQREANSNGQLESVEGSAVKC
jgi:hypothetical protein